jgi:excisionase family DNA binding protein
MDTAIHTRIGAVATPLAYSPQEAADALGCSRGFIYSLMDAGQLHSIKLGGRRLIPASVISEMLAEAV